MNLFLITYISCEIELAAFTQKCSFIKVETKVPTVLFYFIITFSLFQTIQQVTVLFYILFGPAGRLRKPGRVEPGNLSV